jgi:F-type H+-transporting ATPase subunit b
MELLTPDFGLLFWNVLVFLLVLFILSKFAWKPLLAALNEREQTIEQALKSAENAKLEMQKLSADNEKLLVEARAKREEMLRDATKAASEIISKAREEAAVKANADLEAARQTILAEKGAAIAEIKNLVADLSVSLASTLVKKELSSDAAQKELVEKMLSQYTAKN